MDRKQAKELIGRKVSAWTAGNGVYVGTLQEVVVRDGKPWRGVVLIEGVASPAAHFEVGRGMIRKGRDIGETIEVGGVNIRPLEAGYESYVGRNYEDSLVKEIEKLQAILNNPACMHRGLIQKSIEALQQVLHEKRALTSSPS